MRRVVLNLLLAVGLCALLAGPAAAERSPVFGSAEVTVMSPEAANAVTAKGYWADYYGWYAMDAAYTAYVYAYYARYYAASNSGTEQSWYYTAMVNAYNAYIYSYYAYFYSYYGW
jgi:hypothetical protein